MRPSCSGDLPPRAFGLRLLRMNGFIYFNIHDRARLPGRFYGEILGVTARR